MLVPTVYVGLSIAWVVVALGALGFAAVGFARSGWADRLAALGVAVVALVAREQATAGPSLLYCRVRTGLSGDAVPDTQHGLGMPAAWRVLGGLVGSDASETVAYEAMPVVGAVAVVALGVLGRRLGLSAIAAWSAALALALWGFDIRLGHTDSPHVVENAAVLVGAAIAVGAMRGDRAWIAAALGGLWLGLATTLRPEGLVVAVVPVVAVLAGWRPADRRAGGAFLGAWLLGVVPHAIAMVSALQGWTSMADDGGSGGVEHGLFALGLVHLAPLRDLITPRPFSVLIVLGLVLGEGRWRTRAAIGLLAFGLAAAVPTFWTLDADGLGTYRYQLRALPWAALLGGAAIARLVDRVPAGWGPWAALVAVVGAMGSSWADLHRVPTFQAEHALAVAAMREVPTGCVVLTSPAFQDVGLAAPFHLPNADGELPWIVRVSKVGDELPDAPCAYWWRRSTCATWVPQWGTDPCDVVEATFALEPVRVDEIDPVPWIKEPYGDAPLRVGLYRISDWPSSR